MAENDEVNLLDEHAEALRRDADAGDDFPAADVERRPALEGLLNLARRVRSAFKPLEPPPAFVADLKRQLLSNAERLRAATARRREQRKQRAIVAAVSVGGLVYVMGLAALGVRLLISLFGMLLAILGWRRPSQAGRPRGAR